MKFIPKSISIVYASASGNTFDVAQYIRERLLNEGFDVVLKRAELIDPISLDVNELTIFAVSTWEHGEANPYFNNILDYFSKNSNELKVAFVGLGDLRYEPVLFCGGMKQVRDVLVNGGAQEVVKSIRIDGDPHLKLDTLVENWVVSLLENIKV